MKVILFELINIVWLLCRDFENPALLPDASSHTMLVNEAGSYFYILQRRCVY